MKQRGVALIIVLLVVAFVAVIAIEMAGRLQLQVKRTSNIKDSKQAYWYAMGAEAYARKTISQLLQEDDPLNINQPWAQDNIMFPMPNGGIEAELMDMQSCFNLNALQKDDTQNSKAQEKTAFERLLQTDTLEIPPLSVETVRDTTMDWLDSDTIPDGIYGVEDSEYESLLNPYLAANGLMVSKSEFRLVKGVEPAWISRVMPFLCVIPGKTDLRINVNTIHQDRAPLLAALLGSSEADAQNLISNVPYDDKAEFLGTTEVSALNLTQEQQDWFVADTEYFILHVKSRYNNASFAMSSLLKIDSENKVTTVRREFGGKI